MGHHYIKRKYVYCEILFTSFTLYFLLFRIFFTFNVYFQLLQHMKIEILCKFASSQIIFRGIHT